MYTLFSDNKRGIVRPIQFNKIQRLNVNRLTFECYPVDNKFSQSHHLFRRTWHFITRHVTLFGPMTLLKLLMNIIEVWQCILLHKYICLFERQWQQDANQLQYGLYIIWRCPFWARCSTAVTHRASLQSQEIIPQEGEHERYHRWHRQVAIMLVPCSTCHPMYVVCRRWWR